MGISAPELLSKNHYYSGFNCTIPVLNQWLQKQSLKNQIEGGSRTFVVTDTDTGQVVGYYCISTGSVAHDHVSGKIKRNMPDPIPIILQGRLAVDESYARQGIGRGLMKDCFMRVVAITEQVGVRALLVHALDDQSRQYYLGLGFTESPVQERTLMIRVRDIVAALS